MLEGARSSSAFFSNSTAPLDASVRIAVGASPSNPPSSFLAPCTLWLAAWSMPPQPIATIKRTAARTRQERPVVTLDRRKRDKSSAIGSAFREAAF
jgi:hypothetical protein